jgi:hypothetical protein
MTFRYRTSALLPVLLVACTAAAALVAAAWAPSAEACAVLSAPAVTAAALLLVAHREEARRLGVLVLDGAGLRRVRSDGRVVQVVRWDDVREVIVDRARREALVRVPGGGFPVRGPTALGGVGLEHFAAFVDVLPDYTSAPLRLPRHPARPAGGAPARPPPAR